MNEPARKKYPLVRDVSETEHVEIVKEIFATMGRYDVIVTFETDDQTVAFKVASQINNLGVLETETWPVIPFEDFSSLLGR